MKRVSLIFLFLFLSIPFVGCYSQPQNIKEESEVEEARYTWDFGRVNAGEILKHSFIFKNETSKTLNIKEIHTSCGCTASQVQKKKLLSGEVTTIEVSFNTKGYSGPTKQFIYINTDNLDASTSLSINGERSRTIDNSIIRYIIKADLVK